MANESFLFQFLNVLTLGILAAIIRNQAMMHELESGYDDYARLNEALPTPLPIDPPYAYRDHSLNYREKMHIHLYKYIVDFSESEAQKRQNDSSDHRIKFTENTTLVIIIIKNILYTIFRQC